MPPPPWRLLAIFSRRRRGGRLAPTLHTPNPTIEFLGCPLAVPDPSLKCQAGLSPGP